MFDRTTAERILSIRNSITSLTSNPIKFNVFDAGKSRDSPLEFVSDNYLSIRKSFSNKFINLYTKHDWTKRLLGIPPQITKQNQMIPS